MFDFSTTTVDMGKIYRQCRKMDGNPSYYRAVYAISCLAITSLVATAWGADLPLSLSIVRYYLMFRYGTKASLHLLLAVCPWRYTRVLAYHRMNQFFGLVDEWC